MDDVSAPPAAGRGPGRLARAHEWVTYVLRWPIVILWIAGTIFLIAHPVDRAGAPDETASLIPEDSPAARAELRSIDLFGYPLSSRTVVVQRDPAGLSPFVIAESMLDALALNQTKPAWPVLGAIPLVNSAGLGVGAGERNTTVLTYMLMDPNSDFGQQHSAARQYTQDTLERPVDHVVGVSGSVPARAQQSYLLDTHLGWVEGATVVAIFLLVGLAFRSLVVPVIALVASGIAVVATLTALTLLSARLGVSAPAELEPVVVALILGVVTDYTIFFATGYHAAALRFADRREAVRSSVTIYAPIILAAGLTVAAGTLTLVVAQSPFFRAFGPAMGTTIVVGALVSLTFVPAAVAVLRDALFWPRHPPQASESPSGAVSPPAHPSKFARGLIATLTLRPTAAFAIVICTAGLVYASLPLAHVKLGAGFISSLPADNTVREASSAAAAGFAPGVVSPTTLLIEGPGVATQVGALRNLQQRVADESGVATVLGPQQSLPRADLGITLAKNGNAARMLVILDHDPMDATAIADLSRLRERLPETVALSGLPATTTTALAGDSALAEGLVSGTADDLLRIAVVGILVNFAMLALFLRALVAPLYLLGCSILALTASLGLTTWLFTDVLGQDGLTFYVPFAASVLLVSLGSDYNIFGVGRIWEEARHRPLREAIRVAMPETSRAITTAGLALAVSFGMLAIIPLGSFHQLAFAMTVGILIDAFVVRSIMVPALMTLVGRRSAWPRKALGPDERPVEPRIIVRDR